MGTAELKIILEFSAGAELLFGNIKRRQLALDGTKKWNIANLLKWMHANILTERPELFLQGDTVVNWITNCNPTTTFCSYQHFMAVRRRRSD
ncbi:uncharacterized protein Dana_GF23776, isoform B [Drosophila ananassae]|uniref:Ubiquitin-related modifier 1 n=1 Tax=Drosophila ananassae TaxID=7217 RepID=A0A0P8YBD1_DROAN|nr:ubiquitin-related modifier 1 homolog isoform X2 [Drosophila ananassae]KPU78720.1 uncharacterized protein Dana_GF23776, isoform B [Drosophila ananassae]